MSQRRFGVGRRSPIRRLNGYEALLSAQIADGALGAWTMQETSGTTMLDLSGNGRHGAYQNGAAPGAAPVLDIAARAVDFDGANDAAAVGYASWMDSSTWTVEVAANADVVENFDLLAYRAAYFELRLADGKLQIIARNSSAVEFSAVTPAAVISAGESHLYGLRWATGELSGWIDGVKVLTVATTGDARSGANAFYFASAGSGNYFDGRMSHGAYYGTALSDTQMLYHAQAAGLA